MSEVPPRRGAGRRATGPRTTWEGASARSRAAPCAGARRRRACEGGGGKFVAQKDFFAAQIGMFVAQMDVFVAQINVFVAQIDVLVA